MKKRKAIGILVAPPPPTPSTPRRRLLTTATASGNGSFLITSMVSRPKRFCVRGSSARPVASP
jgi:hypothetical protein